MENIDIKVFNVEDYLPLITISKGDKEIIIEQDKDIELGELLKQFSEDMIQEELKNISKERLLHLVKRYRKIVEQQKKKYDYRCQICNENFLMDNGKYYCEAHHLIPISENGSQNADNVIILCANHHRIFHYAKNSVEIEYKKRIVHVKGIKYSF